MVYANSEEELGRAIKSRADEIEISVDLMNTVAKIKATGSVAWAIAIGAIGTAVVFLLTSPGTAGTSAIAAAPTFLVASSALGGSSVAISAIMIAMAAGGVGALNSLRDYRLIDRNGKPVLKRK